jgi:uncharacterized protein YnzC (UPF0291/DUF896 family)
MRERPPLIQFPYLLYPEKERMKRRILRIPYFFSRLFQTGGKGIMLAKEKIDRINALARKAKTVGLTEAEVREQQALRQEYLQVFRREFRKQLESIQFVDDAPVQ